MSEQSKADSFHPESLFQPNSLNLNVRGMPPSATLRINELSNALKQQGKKIYKLGLGQSPFPVPEQVVDALKAHAHEKDYLPVKGLAALREAIAGYLHNKLGVARTGDEVIIGPGSKELLFILQLAYYGDLIIPQPSWVSYAPQAKIIGRNIYWLPTTAENNWQLTAEELENACQSDPTRPRLLILNYPNNPTGCTYSEAQLTALAQVARKYQVIVLSDEIYGELNYEGNHQSIAAWYPEGTIISTGLSKWCGAGGWRLGAFVFPPSLSPLLDAMATIASETFTATSAPIQYAAITAFKGSPEIDQYLTTSRKILRHLGGYIHRRLVAMGLTCNAPEGAFYLFPGFDAYALQLAKRGIHDGPALCRALLEETGVAMLPAADFGFADNFLTVRMAFVDFDGTDALNEAETHYADSALDQAYLDKICPNLVGAMDQMENWLKRL